VVGVVLVMCLETSVVIRVVLNVVAHLERIGDEQRRHGVRRVQVSCFGVSLNAQVAYVVVQNQITDLERIVGIPFLCRNFAYVTLSTAMSSGLGDNERAFIDASTTRHSTGISPFRPIPLTIHRARLCRACA